jgi:Tfp pilus assembly protein FimT
MVALTVAAVIMGIAIPKMAPLRDSAGVRSSKQVLMSYLSTARQAAIRRGQPATFHVNGNRVWVSVNGGADRITPEVNLREQNGVTLTTALATVTFNPRGLANPRLGSSQVLRLNRGISTDSLCVTILGMLGQCGL